MGPSNSVLDNVTVIFSLNQSLQNFEVFLEMISSTSVQNFSREKCLILKWQHILLRVLRQNRVLEIINDVIVMSFSNQCQQTFVFFFVIPRSISVQNLSKIGRETKKFRKIGNDVIVTSFLKITQQFFVCE